MVFSYCAIIHFNNKYLFLPVHIFCHLARIFVGAHFIIMEILQAVLSVLAPGLTAKLHS